ncbi:MAG: hypothetical protein HC768_07840 [Acaryochloris sp. CRU_2_0]|nr:hypothetical protein [Acaryochloris sp. CRU_2_0]
MRRWLKTLYDKQYFPAIAPLIDTPQDRQISAQWAAWMKQQWQDHGLKDLKQQRNLMTEVRQALKRQLGENHIALQAMNFTRDEWIEINLSISDTVATRNEQQSLIEQPNAIVDRAKMLLDSRDWAEVAAGLAVVTGRRCTELLQTAEFIYESPYTVWFTGALKRRQEERTLRFEIPTLAPAQQVIAALSKLRRTVNTVGLDLETINRKFSPPVAKACDLHFAELVPQRAGRGNLYTHLFRTIYARIATHWYAPPTVADIEYMAAIQGHFLIQNEQDPTLRRSLASTRHYNDYKIGDGRGNINGRQGVRLNDPGVQILKIFQQGVPGLEPEPLMPEEESPMLPPSKRQLSPKRDRSTLWLYRDERDRWLQLLQPFAPKASQPDQMSALLAWIEQSLPENRPSFTPQIPHPSIPRPPTPAKTLEQSANAFITTLLPLRDPEAIRSLCQQELAELEQTYDSQDYLPIYEGAIATAIRSGQLPLIDQQTAERLSYTKQGVSYVQRTHYALRFLADPEHEIELTTAPVSTPTPISKPITPQRDTLQTDPAPTLTVQPQIAVTPQSDQPSSSSPTTHTLDHKLEVLTHALSQLVQLIQTERTIAQQFPVPAPSNGQTQPGSIQPESLDTQEATSEQSAKTPPSSTVKLQRRSRGTSAEAEARIIKAIDAMMAYNNAPHRTHIQKWEISLSALKRLTKSYQGVIQRVLDAHEAEIQEHHQLHGLKSRHNVRHGHAGVNIEQVIQWEPD